VYVASLLGTALVLTVASLTITHKESLAECSMTARPIAAAAIPHPRGWPQPYVDVSSTAECPDLSRPSAIAIRPLVVDFAFWTAVAAGLVAAPWCVRYYRERYRHSPYLL
jgi:hypothetical protein